MVIFGHIISHIVWSDHDVADDLSVTAAVPQPTFLAGHDDEPSETEIAGVSKLPRHDHDASTASANRTASFTKCDTGTCSKVTRIVRNHNRSNSIR